MEKKKQTEEEKKKAKATRSSIILFTIVLLLIGFISYFKYSNLIKDMYYDFGFDGTLALLSTVVLLIFAIIVFPYKKENKSSWIRIAVFIFISAGIAVMFLSSSSFEDINFQVIILTLAVSCFFGYLIAWADKKIPDFFAKVGIWWNGRIFNLFFAFFIPMMFVCILFLGANHGKYQYESTLLQDYKSALENKVSPALIEGFYSLVEKVYTIGEERPEFYWWLCIGLTIFLFILAMFKKSWEIDEETTAQQLLDKVDYNDLSKKDLKDIEMLLQGKMRKKHFERMEKARKKAEERNEYPVELIINLNKVKGGKI